MTRFIAAIVLAASLTGCTTSRPATTLVGLSHQLAQGHFETVYDHGKLVSCTATRSTGDSELDHLACDVARECALERPVAPPIGFSGDACADKKTYAGFKRIVTERSSGKP
jgi:hypothetical protein